MKNRLKIFFLSSIIFISYQGSSHAFNEKNAIGLLKHIVDASSKVAVEKSKPFDFSSDVSKNSLIEVTSAACLSSTLKLSECLSKISTDVCVQLQPDNVSVACKNSFKSFAEKAEQKEKKMRTRITEKVKKFKTLFWKEDDTTKNKKKKQKIKNFFDSVED